MSAGVSSFDHGQTKSEPHHVCSLTPGLWCSHSLSSFLHLVTMSVTPIPIPPSAPPPEWDLLLSASQKNQSDRIRHMISKQGVNPNHSNSVGQSALHIAALWGHGK